MRKWGEAGSVAPWLCPGSKCLWLLGRGCWQWPPQEKREWEGASAHLEKLSWLFQGVHSPQQSPSQILLFHVTFQSCAEKYVKHNCSKGRYKQLLPGLPDIPTLGCVTACRRNPCKFRDLHIFKMPSSCNSSWAIFYLHAVLLPVLGYWPLPLLGLPLLGLIFRKIPRALSALS